MKKVVLLFVLLLAFSFSFASNGLVEKSSALQSNTVEFTQTNTEEGVLMTEAEMNALAPDSIWICTYLGGGWWYCERVVVVIM